MKYEEILRSSRRLEPGRAAVARWNRAVFGDPVALERAPGWVPSLVSGLAMVAMLVLLWPAAARGPVTRVVGEACDGRWERSLPLRADVRGLARPQPMRVEFRAAEQCGLCHVSP